MKKSIRIALSFATFTNDQLNSFVILLLVCLKNNALFPNLPVKLADLTVLLTTYQQAMVQAAIGGEIDTAALSEARDALIFAIRQIAGYVQSLGLTNESDVLSSGFDIILPGKNTPQPLIQPVVALDNSVSGQLGVGLAAVPNAKAYQVQFGADGGKTWLEAGIFPNTRNIIIANLTPGTVYSVRVRAVGGSTQYSPWSATIALMST